MSPMDEEPSLDSLEIGQRGAAGGPPRRRGDRSIWVVLIVAVLALALLGYFLWWRPRREPVTPPADTVVAAEGGSESSSNAGEPDPVVALPALAVSDPVIRDLLATLTDHPSLVAVLAPDQLVRRFVASVDNIADGVSPRPHLGFLQPRTGFHTDVDGGELVTSEESYDRYDRWADLLASIDAEKAARLYRRLEPLFQEAYVELGYPRADFRATLLRAIDRVLAAPSVPPEEPLIASVSTYSYRDPALESMGEVEKHLARMGPENARRVQVKLAEIRAAIAAGARGRDGVGPTPDVPDPDVEG